jgi:hypothetical protein
LVREIILWSLLEFNGYMGAPLPFGTSFNRTISGQTRGNYSSAPHDASPRSLWLRFGVGIAEKKLSPMKMQEYAIVSLTAKFVGSEVTIYWPDGRETVDEKALVLVLNDMSAQGWEIVTSAGGYGVFQWTLKRG